MSRLTNKNFIYCQGRMSGKTIFKQMFDKLYALEDLEEELGCPLDVVFKALKEGIIVDDTVLIYNAYSYEAKKVLYLI